MVNLLILQFWWVSMSCTAKAASRIHWSFPCTATVYGSLSESVKSVWKASKLAKYNTVQVVKSRCMQQQVNEYQLFETTFATLDGDLHIVI